MGEGGLAVGARSCTPSPRLLAPPQVLGRGERLELLVEKTDEMGQQAFAFKRQVGCVCARCVVLWWCLHACAALLAYLACGEKNNVPRLLPTPLSARCARAGTCASAAHVVAECPHGSCHLRAGAAGGLRHRVRCLQPNIQVLTGFDSCFPHSPT